MTDQSLITQPDLPPRGGELIPLAEAQVDTISRTKQLGYFADAYDWLSREILPFANNPGELSSGFSPEVATIIEDRKASLPKRIDEALDFMTENPSLMPEQRRGSLEVELDRDSGWVRVNSGLEDQGPYFVSLTQSQFDLLLASRDPSLDGKRNSMADFRGMLPELASETDEGIQADLTAIQAKFEATGHGAPLIGSRGFVFPDVTLSTDVTLAPPPPPERAERRTYPFSHRISPGRPARTVAVYNSGAFEDIRALAAEAQYNGKSFTTRQLCETLGLKPHTDLRTILERLATLPDNERLVGISARESTSASRWQDTEYSIKHALAPSFDPQKQRLTDVVTIKGLFEFVGSDNLSLVVPADTATGGTSIEVSVARQPEVTLPLIQLGSLALLAPTGRARGTGSEVTVSPGAIDQSPELQSDELASQILASLEASLLETAEAPQEAIMAAIELSKQAHPELAQYMKFDPSRWELALAQARPLIESARALEHTQPELSAQLFAQATGIIGQTIGSIEAEARKAREFTTLKEMVETLSRIASAGAIEVLTDEDLSATASTIFAGEEAIRNVLVAEMNKRALEALRSNGWLKPPVERGRYGERFANAQTFEAFRGYLQETFGVDVSYTAVFDIDTHTDKQNPLRISFPHRY